jgi:hypothetical protein
VLTDKSARKRFRPTFSVMMQLNYLASCREEASGAVSGCAQQKMRRSAKSSHA